MFGMRSQGDTLLDAAASALAVNPGASMQEIADAIGISRATLHRQFAGRDELIEAIGAWAIGELESSLDAVDATGLQGLAAVEALLEYAVRLVPKIGFLMSEYSIENNEGLMTRVDVAERRWGGFVEDGQRRGEIRIDIPARWIVDATQGLLLAIFHGVRHGMTAPNDARRLVRLTLFDGIRNPDPNSSPNPSPRSTP